MPMRRLLTSKRPSSPTVNNTVATSDRIPELLERVGHRLARFILVVGALLLAATLALTVVDVFGRYILNAPVNGKTELTRFLMAGLIACALPVITVRSEHITVDLFDSFYSPRIAALRDLIVDAICAGTLLVLVDWLIFRSERLLNRGYTSDFLELPLYPVAYFITLMFFVSAIALICKLVIDAIYIARPELKKEVIRERTFEA